MSPIVPLTAIQQKALALISAGSTIAAAASETGVHRNTVGNWLRSSNFRQSLELACLDQAIFWRDQAHQMAGDALAAIRAILTDPKAPAAVRLRAALAVLEKASAPLPQLPAGLREFAASPAPENAPPMHNSAQRVPEIKHMQAPEPAPMHNHAQPQPPKSVLSQPCPCGSRLKFMYCCLRKPSAAVPDPLRAAIEMRYAGTRPQTSS